MLGAAQVLIKQVIMYHECTCDHADMSGGKGSQPQITKVVTERLLTENDRDIDNALINSNESAWSRSLARSKKNLSKSKSMSLASILEINVTKYAQPSYCTLEFLKCNH